MNHQNALARALVTSALVFGLAACGGGIGGFNNASRGTADNLPPDHRGVISYASYQVAVARDGDTLADIAGRVGGASAAELGALNGLPPDYRLREGEVVALPDTVPRGGGGFGAAPGGGFDTGLSPGGGWSPEIATSAIDRAPGATAPAPAVAPFGNGQSDLVIDPIRHRVEPGETAYSIARLYGVSVTALASWNGLGSDLAVRENQELLIPVVSGANQIQSGAGGGSAPGQGTVAGPPPSASQPLPQDVTASANPASPNLGQYRTPAGGRLARPVDGPITKEYNPGSGPNRSEGIGFSVPAGTPVRAAGPGEVALVSESLGGLGTIVLIRHRDDLMTVYGRVENVSVQRGQQVAAGQAIGAVAAQNDPGLHFEVRRGTDSVDPMTYLGG
jgi:lipoprotein NlpD